MCWGISLTHHVNNSTLIFTHTCWGTCLDGASQQINGGPERHLYRIFLVCTHHVNKSTVIFTHTCWGISLGGACQRINGGPERHLYRIFWVSTHHVNKSTLIFACTCWGTSLTHHVNKSTVIFSTPIPDFFGPYPSRQQINAHICIHMLGYQSNSSRQQINVHFHTHVGVHTNLFWYHSGLCQSTNQRWSRSHYGRDFFWI